MNATERSQPPWADGPSELLRHGLELLRKDTDIARRLAFISIDNAVELMIRTYLGLPKRITRLEITRKQIDDIGESFPALLNALEIYAADRLSGVDLGSIEWHHRLRNQLYHHGNGLTIERNKAEVYAQIANQLFQNLFGFVVPEMGGLTTARSPSQLVRRPVVIGQTVHEIIPASDRDLPDLMRLYNQFFGSDSPSLASMQSWLRRSKKGFWLVLVRSHKRLPANHLVGSFKLLPMTNVGMAALNAEAVAGSAFNDHHIAGRSQDTVAYYIGDVIGTTRVARAVIVSYLHQLLYGDLAKFPVYARPLTCDGQRIMLQAGFYCVADRNQPALRRICRLDPRQHIGGHG